MSLNAPAPTYREEAQRLEEIERLAKSADIPRLIQELDEPSWMVRRRVTAALARAGEPAVEPLCELLRDRRDDEGRIAATVEALSSSVTNDEEPIAELARNPNSAVVSDAAQILGRRRSSQWVGLLVSLLSHPDDNVAVSAVEALGRIGGRAAVDALLEVLRSDNFFRVFPAIEVLGRSGDPRAVGPLSALLDRPHYAREATRALGRTGERHAIAPLAALLSHPADTTVRLSAVALADLDARYRERYGLASGVEETIRHACVGTRALQRLIHVVMGADPDEQIAVCMVLGAIGDPAAAPILSQLFDGPATVTSAAGSALRKLGHRCESELLRALREGDSARRKSLLPLLSRASAVHDVLTCLDDPDASVRALACDTLARIGDVSVVPSLFHLLEDLSPRVSQAALSAIQSMGGDGTQALAEQTARSPNPLARRAGLRILSYFGWGSSFPTFRDALQDPDARVRDAALQGLAFIDDPRAIETLLAAARDPAERVRAGALRSLGQCSDDARIRSALIKGLGDPDPWARYFACQSLGKLGCENAGDAIAKLVQDEAGQVRVAAVEALSHLESAVAENALQSAAQSEEPDMQRAALIGLGIAKRESALPVLLKALADPDGATRLVAVSALSTFSTPQVLQALARTAADPDEGVRTAAIGLLSARPGGEPSAILIRLLARPTEPEKVIAALEVCVEGRIPAILAALRTADDELASRLTSVLARMHRPDARAALLAAVVFPNAACRKAAAATLAATGSREGLMAVKRAAREDPDPRVREICSVLVAD